MSNEVSCPSSIEDFRRRKFITDVLQTLKSGKEATVYRCAAHPRTGQAFLALKAYRAFDQRSFHQDAMYRDGQFMRESRTSRAIRDRSAFGLGAALAQWSSREHASLRLLHRAGLAVPEPIAKTPDALLLEFIGDDEAAAPQLRCMRFDRGEAERCWTALLSWIRRALQLDLVHGDLSTYNVLWWRGQPMVIDLPQAVDARLSSNAEYLLRRDIVGLARSFARWGVVIDGEGIADAMWRSYERGEIDTGSTQVGHDHGA
ncbi:MAG: serine protein kinase RIO [Planctomycetes bacterium]|nr:serine protein kinase RIO [Planctomycetota bacterium]